MNENDTRPQSLDARLATLGDSARAFERLAERRAALPAHKVEAVNRDVQKTASQVLASAERVRTLKGSVEALPGGEGLLDHVIDAALAAWHAEVVCGSPVRDPAIAAAVKDARTCLRRLSAVAQLLVTLGAIPATEVDAIPSASGYAGLAAALRGTADLLRRREAIVREHVAYPESDITDAQRLVTAVLTASGRARMDPGAQRAARAAERDRAFTMMMQAYRALRAGVGWVRRDEGDAAKWAPGIGR